MGCKTLVGPDHGLRSLLFSVLLSFQDPQVAHVEKKAALSICVEEVAAGLGGHATHGDGGRRAVSGGESWRRGQRRAGWKNQTASITRW